MTLWLSKKLVVAVEQSLLSVGPGPVGGLELGKLSKALHSRGVEIQEVNLDEGRECEFAAIVVENMVSRSDWAEEMQRLRSLLKPEGRLVSIDKRAPAEVSRRFLCSGLSDLSQRELGRQVLTTGRA